MLVLELCFGSEENWVISSNLGNYGNSTEEMSFEPFLIGEWEGFSEGEKQDRNGRKKGTGWGGGAGQCLAWGPVSCLVMAEPLGSWRELWPKRSPCGLIVGVLAWVPRSVGFTVRRWRAITRKAVDAALCLVCFDILVTEQGVQCIVGAREMLCPRE